MLDAVPRLPFLERCSNRAASASSLRSAMIVLSFNLRSTERFFIFFVDELKRDGAENGNTPKNWPERSEKASSVSFELDERIDASREP